MLETTAILISFILIVLVVQLIFSQQNQQTYQSVFESLGRDISISIDRASATAGNIQIQQDVPSGLQFKLQIDQKAIIINYGNQNSVRTFFSSDIKSGPYNFVNPKSLCVVKTANDNAVYITNTTCACNPNDKTCDPSCNVENKCDPSCVNSTSIGVCNPYCTLKNPSSCDMNCYRSYQTGVCEKNCIAENQTDGICSPDCNGLSKGVCDLDCYNQYSNGKTGNCDPDCPPKSSIATQNGIKVKLSDGHCYTGCLNVTTTPSSASNPSPLSGTCNTNDHSNLQCEDGVVWGCGQSLLTCAYGNLCSTPCVYTSYNLCCSTPNGSPVLNATDSVCCCQYKGGTCSLGARHDCLVSGGYAYPSNSQYCQTSSIQKQTTPLSKITLVSDGVCDLDCNATANICDPDCPNSPACQNICSKENEKATDTSPCCDGLVACPGDHICHKSNDSNVCCGNGYCEGRPGTTFGWPEGFKTKWETSYTCPKDCSGPTTPPTCQTGGTQTGAACYEDVRDSLGRRIGQQPTWSTGKIQICNQNVIDFLNRRNWDINQVFQTFKSNTPEGWAWEGNRYVLACQRLQQASLTITANENYSQPDYACCCPQYGCDVAEATYTGPQCCGVGFCADHGVAVLSILRTLGIPAKDVYITFDIGDLSCNFHSYVLMKCDTDLKNAPGPANLWPTDCNGNENQWLRVDATGHFVKPLSQSPCVTMCMWWNDQGIYPLTAGKIDAQSGWAIPPGVRCGGNLWDPSNSKCNQGPSPVDCNLPQLCQAAGAPPGFNCKMPGY